VLLKEVYNQRFLNDLAAEISRLDADFDAKRFLKILQKDWQEKPLKTRMRAISKALGETLLHKKYPQQLALLKQVVLALNKDKNSGLALIIFPDFVEIFGQKDFELSMQALEFFTEFSTSEFAIRRFIKADEDAALKFVKKFAVSKNYHVRRLASEGIRPRLPWGEALPNFKKDPQKILPILEVLKFDSKKYVQKSIANNLNDISKDNPKIALDLLARWQGEGVAEFIIRHALRTLLKKGDQAALKIIGADEKKFEIQDFLLSQNQLQIGQKLVFNFSLKNLKAGSKIRLEYAIYFLKKNGTYSKKNFQITTKIFDEKLFSFSKKHSFADLSTRKHCVGKHLISLVANGVEFGKTEFHLI
jgi:3-methyladenine DNA glycosylase AlkC